MGPAVARISVCLLQGIWEQAQQRLLAWLASPFKLNTGEFRVFGSLFHYSSLFLESSCTKSFVRIQFVVSDRIARQGLVECSSVLCKPQGFLPIIAWIHTLSSIYSSSSHWSQKLGFIAELSQKLQWKELEFPSAAQSAMVDPLLCLRTLRNNNPHPWSQSRLSPSRLCLARSQYYISLSHAAESHKLLPSCSMSRTGLVENKEMVFTAQLHHLEQMVD